MHIVSLFQFLCPERDRERERAVSTTIFDPVFIDSKAHTISSKFCGARRSRH